MSVAIKSSVVDTAQNKRALLAERLREAARQSAGSPLSFAQQRLWFLDQLEPNSPLYNIPIVARMSGPLEPGALEQALDAIIERHESLRTRFVCVEQEPRQIIDQDASLKLRVIDLASGPETEQEGETNRFIQQEVTRPFDLNADRLIRGTLLRLKKDRHVLILVVHHIICDEWSLKILFRELKSLYEAFVLEQPPALSALIVLGAKPSAP